MQRFVSIRSAVSIGAVAALLIGASVAAKPRVHSSALAEPRDAILHARSISAFRAAACSGLVQDASSDAIGAPPTCPGTLSAPEGQYNHVAHSRLAFAN